LGWNSSGSALINRQEESFKSALDFIDPSKHAAIKAATLSGNLNAEFDLICDYQGNVYFPAGKYPVSLASDYSIHSQLDNVEWVGDGIGRTIIENITTSGIPARPLLITEGANFVCRKIDFKAASNGLGQPTIAGGTIPLGSAIMIMGEGALFEECGCWHGWDNGFTIAKISLTTGINVRGSPSDVKLIKCISRHHGRGIQTMTGPGVPSPHPFQSGAGFNNICGGRVEITSCKDYFSTNGFANDYAGGGQCSFNMCVSYGPEIDTAYTYPDRASTPGGLGFYLGARQR
jgi:hypothetical protein